MCKLDTRWVEKYNVFSDFIRVYNRVPTAPEKHLGVNIGTWYAAQKSFYKKGNLSRDRLVSLDNLCPFWYKSSEFNKYLKNSSTKIIKVNFGETPINKLVSGDELVKFLSSGIHSIEDLYKMGYYNGKVEYCTLAFEKLFPYMKFYEARLLKDVYKNNDFLKIENLKKYLTIKIQKELSYEIQKSLCGMLPQRYQALEEVYVLNKSYIEGAKSMQIGVHTFAKLVAWGIKSLRCSDIIMKLETVSSSEYILDDNTMSYSNLLDTLYSIKGNLPWYSKKEFDLRIKPLLSSVPLDSLGMSYRCTSNLKGSGIQTLNDLLYYTDIELLGLPNIGVASVREVNTKLEPLKALLFRNKKISSMYKKKVS